MQQSAKKNKGHNNDTGKENGEVRIICPSCVRQPSNSTSDCKLRRWEGVRQGWDAWLQSEPNVHSNKQVEINSPPSHQLGSCLADSVSEHGANSGDAQVTAERKTPKRHHTSADEGDPGIFRQAFHPSVWEIGWCPAVTFDPLCVGDSLMSWFISRVAPRITDPCEWCPLQQGRGS